MLPASPGIGLKSQHYQDILQAEHNLEWFELHPENYMGQGGLPHAYLQKIRSNYQISMHGVGMSLGSADGIDSAHLERLGKLVNQYEPAVVSEHIAWSHGREIFHNDLLPVPYTQESLQVLADNIDRVQSALNRTILVENPSVYLAYSAQDFPEAEFIREVQKKTGCKLLLDINNVYVSANNLGFDAEQYLQQYPLHAVEEIHLAGHSRETIEDGCLLIDDHGSPVTEAVWQLYCHVINRLPGQIPVLIEWDTDVPSFQTMLDEANLAKAYAKKQVAA